MALMSQENYTAPQNTNITWQGKAAYNSYAPEGSLTILSASLTESEDSITELNVVIDMRTLEQENTRLRDHLRDEDFFDVQRFPVASFTLTSPASVSDSVVLLSGNMTIKGETRTEEIKATLTTHPDGLLLTFEHSMDRTLYGVNFNSPSFFSNLKDQAIADEFVLKGSIVFASNYTEVSH